MRADGLLELRPQLPYGPTLIATENGNQLMNEYPKTLGKYRRSITFVADALGDKNVADLERLATALFVTLENQHRSEEERVEGISDLKPHIDREAAETAVREVDKIMAASAKALDRRRFPGPRQGVIIREASSARVAGSGNRARRKLRNARESGRPLVSCFPTRSRNTSS
jgi:hypothetical protein